MGSLNVYKLGLWLLFAAVCWISLSSSQSLILNYGKGGGGGGGGGQPACFLSFLIEDCRKLQLKGNLTLNFKAAFFCSKKDSFHNFSSYENLLFLCISLGGYSVLTTSLFMSPMLFFESCRKSCVQSTRNESARDRAKS